MPQLSVRLLRTVPRVHQWPTSAAAACLALSGVRKSAQVTPRLGWWAAPRRERRHYSDEREQDRSDHASTQPAQASQEWASLDDSVWTVDKSPAS
jgi:hypothetical protein